MALRALTITPIAQRLSFGIIIVRRWRAFSLSLLFLQRLKVIGDDHCSNADDDNADFLVFFAASENESLNVSFQKKHEWNEIRLSAQRVYLATFWIKSYAML